MRKSIMTAAVLACLAHGQPADSKLTFDAAAIKPFIPPSGGKMMIGRGGRGGPGSTDPGRIHYTAINLRNLLTNAYDVKDYQIVGPSYLDSERFDVQATMPPETTKEQFRTMLQNLLAERFKLTIHRENKELPMYALVVAKNGPKLKESVETPDQKPTEDEPRPIAMPSPGQMKFDPEGFPILPMPSAGGRGSMFMMMMPNRARIMAQKQTMQDLAERLSQMLSKPVKDETALKAKFDFVLTYSPEGLNTGMGMSGPPPPPPPGARPDNGFIPEGEAPQNLFSAIQAQLGLKLDAKKGPVDLVVVDHMEKTPTEN